MHCPAVGEELNRLSKTYKFEKRYADADDSDLIEHYNVTQLPALVIHAPTLTSPVVLQSVRVPDVEGTIKQHFAPKLVLTEDF